MHKLEWPAAPPALAPPAVAPALALAEGGNAEGNAAEVELKALLGERGVELVLLLRALPAHVDEDYRGLRFDRGIEAVFSALHLGNRFFQARGPPPPLQVRPGESNMLPPPHVSSRTWRRGS